MTRRIPGAVRGRPSQNGHAKTPVPSTENDGGVLSCVSAADLVTGRPRVWLWDSHICFGVLHELSGPKGVGKSTLLSALAADVTGGPRIDGGRRRKGRPVLWLVGEEEPERDVRPKLVAAGADLSLVRFPGRDQYGRLVSRVELPSHLSQLGSLVQSQKAGLLLVDPWSSCLAAGASSTDPVATRQIMLGLAGIAQSTDAAVICTRNHRKDKTGPAVDAGLGSSEVSNVCRQVLQIRPHPDVSRWRVLCWAAGNLCEPPIPRAFSCELHAGSVRIQWRGEMDLTADQLSEQETTSAGRDERLDAHALLAPIIRGQVVATREILAEARHAGVCERSLRAAKSELGIKSRRVTVEASTHWEWYLPGARKGE